MTPDFSHDAWQTFTADHDPADARRRFQERYGQQPQFVALDTRFKIATLKAGPTPDRE